MAQRFVMAIDQGTTSTRCIVFDQNARLVSVAQREHRQYYPRPGWVEQDAVEIWRNVDRIMPQALREAGIAADQVVALGIANQRETMVVWDRHTGVPVGRAIVWEDIRTEELIASLSAQPGLEEVRRRCGLPLATYFSAPSLRWQLDNVAGLRDRAERGDVLFGTMDTWLIWNLTGGVNGGLPVTDVTNASRTMLMNLTTQKWDAELLSFFDVPAAMLPEILPSTEIHGVTTRVVPGIRIAAALGDQHAALFGQTCFSRGETKCTYGTGSFLLMNTGTTLVRSDNGLLTTIGYQLGGEPVTYALEGSIAVTGSLVQWFRDNLGMIHSAPEIETLARTVTDNGGCYIVPAFSGLFAPHWHSEARGIIVGLTSYITKGHLARAVLEATGWQTRGRRRHERRPRRPLPRVESGRWDDRRPPPHAVHRRRAGCPRHAPHGRRNGVTRRRLRRRPRRRLLARPRRPPTQLAPRRPLDPTNGPAPPRIRVRQLETRRRTHLRLGQTPPLNKDRHEAHQRGLSSRSATP
jgi:glycerol kinase